MTFSTQKYRFPSKNRCLEVQCTKCVCYVCFAAQIRFCCKSD